MIAPMAVKHGQKRVITGNLSCRRTTLTPCRCRATDSRREAHRRPGGTNPWLPSVPGGRRQIAPCLHGGCVRLLVIRWKGALAWLPHWKLVHMWCGRCRSMERHVSSEAIMYLTLLHLLLLPLPRRLQGLLALRAVAVAPGRLQDGLLVMADWDG